MNIHETIKKKFAVCCLLSIITFSSLAAEQTDNTVTTKQEEALKATGTINAANIKNSYESGAESFTRKDYEQSLIHFNKALSQGDESAKLVYGLGSTHYRLKNYKKSHEYFSRLTDNKKFGALAYYNLGLISNKQGDNKTAVKYFKKSASTTQNETLKKLSKKQISTLTKKTRKNWFSYVSAGYGYDSNITSAPAGVATNESGTFIRASALGSLAVKGNQTQGVVAKASVYATDYFDTSFNDDKSLAIDFSLRKKLDRWRLSYDAGIKQSTYGADDYQRIYRFTFNAKVRPGKKDEFRLRYRYEDINSLSTRFDYLDGYRQKLRAEYRIRQTTARLRLQYELEINNRQNTNNPQLPTRRNYSPTRNKVALKYDIKLDAKNSFGSEVEYRDSSYAATATQNRSDSRFGAAIDHTYSFDKYWRLKTRIRYRNNNSNEPGELFDYERTVTSIDLSRQF